MFGYVRPFVPALRVKEHELYKGIYCGLCHALGRRYGFAARFLVNYDLCFFALLLWEGKICLRKKRCAAHFFRKRGVCCIPDAADCNSSGMDTLPPALSAAADAAVLVSVWKLEDNRRDEGLWKRFAAGIALLFLKRARRRAEAALPDTSKAAQRAMNRLWNLEKIESDSLDACADCFADLLSALSFACAEEKKRRIARVLLYQLGRWIYISDAADDLERDIKRKSFNPLRARFGLQESWTEEALRQVRATLSLSRQSMLDTAVLWPEKGACVPVWHNILEDGLAAREEQIFTRLMGEKHERPL